jgi:hypothetical protein
MLVLLCTSSYVRLAYRRKKKLEKDERKEREKSPGLRLFKTDWWVLNSSYYQLYTRRRDALSPSLSLSLSVYLCVFLLCRLVCCCTAVHRLTVERPVMMMMKAIDAAETIHHTDLPTVIIRINTLSESNRRQHYLYLNLLSEWTTAK